MNVIAVTDFALNYGKTFLVSDFMQQLIKAAANCGREDFPAVLDAPDDVIIDVVYACSCVCIFSIYTYSISCFEAKVQ